MSMQDALSAKGLPELSNSSSLIEFYKQRSNEQQFLFTFLLVFLYLLNFNYYLKTIFLYCPILNKLIFV